MLSSDNGYPLQWFVDGQSLDDYLKCGICGNVLRDPRATRCGHVFCLSCLLGWIDAYGICPQRCGEVEADQMKRALHIEKRISGLLTLCKYQQYGCAVQVPLVDKALHESTCPYNRTRQLTKCVSHQSRSDRSHESQGEQTQTRKASPKRTRSSAGTAASHHTGLQTKSGATTKRSPTFYSTRTCQLQYQQRIPTGMNHQLAAMQATTLSFRLKRTRAKEPLGLVLVCGEKTPEGKPLSFYVKKVNPDTLGWKAGIEAGDRIVQVDFHDLHRIDPQEAVARIKDKATVSLTVLRGFPKPAHLSRTKSDQEHIYDEILYADALSQQDENLPPVVSAALSALNARRHRLPMTEDHTNRSSKAAHKRPVSPAGNTFFRTSSGPPAPKHHSTTPHHHRSHQSHRSDRSYHHVHHTNTRQGENQGSKDSGLSSGSSGIERHRNDEVAGQQSNHLIEDMHAFERSVFDRRSGRAAGQDVKKRMLIENRRRASDSGVQPPARRNCRIEGDYEVEEIYLEKNGTSQLGVTLGYDLQTSKGHLYVCEVLPTGLAAQDGRLQCGDIIRRVNGFEVYDPEEAVLLFLEQDQDITLTVARKIKQAPSHTRLQTSPPRSFSHSQPEGEHNYAVLEAKSSMLDNMRHMRRIDSCGSLDSHTHRYFSESHHRHPHSPASSVGIDHAHQCRQPTPHVRVNVDEDERGYEVLNRGRCSSAGSSNVRHHSKKNQSPPRLNSSRNPSPLCMESTMAYPSPVAPSGSPDYIIQEDHTYHHTHTSALTASDCQFRPIPASETRMRPRTSSGDRNDMSKPLPVSGIVRPSSTTPASRNKINSQGSSSDLCEPKIMSPLSPTRKVPQSFKMLAGELNQLPSRCDPQSQLDIVFSRSESLV